MIYCQHPGPIPGLKEKVARGGSVLPLHEGTCQGRFYAVQRETGPDHVSDPSHLVEQEEGCKHWSLVFTENQ